MGIRSLAYTFDPDMIVLAGGLTNAGDDLLLPLKEKLDIDVDIQISSLKSDAGIIGAAMLQ